MLLNTTGGVLLRGAEQHVTNCIVAHNGSGGGADGGVVVGVSCESANNCLVELCTLAHNTPFGAKRGMGTGSDLLSNETYSNIGVGYSIAVTAPSPTLKRFVVDAVHSQLIIGGSVSNGPASSSLKVQFFAALDISPGQGADYFANADLTLATNSSGTGTFFHKIPISQVFDNELYSPVPYSLNGNAKIVMTATSLVSTGTSAFSNESTDTNLGDFDLNGAVDGADYIIWQQNAGATNAQYWQGDADFDGDVDAADKAIWQANYGT